MEYKVLYDIKAEDLINLRKVLGWREINFNQVKKGLKNTMYKVSISYEKQVIACGRLIGDYSCKGVLSDILVHPDYQGKGLGKIIVTSLLKQVEEGLNEGEQFQIEATPTYGNRDFYIKCGLKYKPENQDGVYIWIKK